MKASKKLSYIWDYYKFYIVGVPLALLLLAYIIFVFSSSKDVPFSVYFINQNISLEDAESYEEELRREETLTAAADEVYVDISLTITPDTPDFDSQMSFTTAISGHTIDIMIGDEAFFAYYSSKSAFADLSEFLPPDLYESLSPYIIESENEEGLMTPYAIDLSRFSYFGGSSFNTPILTIAKYSEHQEACIAFLRLLCN